MIISASRRTDIPAFYNKWFFKTFKGKIGFKNTEETLPFSAFQVSLEHFKKGVNLEEIIEDCVIKKIKEIEDSETK